LLNITKVIFQKRPAVVLIFVDKGENFLTSSDDNFSLPSTFLAVGIYLLGKLGIKVEK